MLSWEKNSTTRPPNVFDNERPACTHIQCKLMNAGTMGISRSGSLIKTDCDIQQGDILFNTIHRHEPPVPCSLPVLYEDNEIIVVDKPMGTPTHPGGRYEYNTALSMLERERGGPLFVVHRLDRLTSGVLIFAKSSQCAASIQRGFGRAHKEYYCRVVGDVESCTINTPIVETEAITKQRVQVGAGGKPATTVIERLSYDRASNTTLVRAVPQTGRMHQIRVHLQSIQHPIANDSMYRDREEYTELLTVCEGQRVEGCRECLEGVKVSREELWLHCFSMTVTVGSEKKTFTSKVLPSWATESFECVGYLQEWDAHHPGVRKD